MFDKTSFDNLKSRFGDGIRRFGPAHLCALAIVLVTLTGRDVSDAKDFSLNLTLGLYWGALAGVFVQLLTEAKGGWRLRRAVLPVTVAVATLGSWLWFAITPENARYMHWTMFYGGTLVALSAVCLVVLPACANRDERLYARLFFNAAAAQLATFVLLASVLVCVWAFDQLLVDVSDKRYYDVFLAVVRGVAPALFLAFLPDRRPSDRTAERLTTLLFWLLLPGALVLLLILYLYLGRIAVTRTLPSGMLNWFGSIALAGYVFFWLTLRGATNRFFRAFVRFGWLLLVPVVALQVVCVVIRYNAHGLTTPRLAGMVTLAAGLLALALAAFRRAPSALFAFLAVAGLVFTLSPVNIIDTPFRDQERRLRDAFVRNGLYDGTTFTLAPKFAISEADAKTINSAWDYLLSRNRWRRDVPRLRATVWHRKAFAQALVEQIEELDKTGTADLHKRLLRFLNIEDLVIKARDWEFRYPSVTFLLPPDEVVALGDYTRVRALNDSDLLCIQSNPNRKDRWMLRFKRKNPIGKGHEEYDVTDAMGKLIRTIPDDVKGEDERALSPTDAVIQLTPDAILLISRITISCSREKSDPWKISAINFNAAVLAVKPETPAKEKKKENPNP